MKEIRRLHEHEISIAGLFCRKPTTQEKGYTLVSSPPQSACQISWNIFPEYASVAGQGLHSRLTTLTLNSLSSLGGLILPTHYTEVIHQGRRPTGKQSTIGQPACLRPVEFSAST
jgi:hypothetical protein